LVADSAIDELPVVHLRDLGMPNALMFRQVYRDERVCVWGGRAKALIFIDKYIQVKGGEEGRANALIFIDKNVQVKGGGGG
jgi:hypothetical protein